MPKRLSQPATAACGMRHARLNLRLPVRPSNTVRGSAHIGWIGWGWGGDRTGGDIPEAGKMREGGREGGNCEQQNQRKCKIREIVVDNNLLWRGKAYSFGHFVRDLRGHAPHVQHAGRPLAH